MNVPINFPYPSFRDDDVRGISSWCKNHALELTRILNKLAVQQSLSNLVPYSGAVNDVDLGIYDLKATELTASGLTAGRAVYTGTGGLLSASANALLTAAGNMTLVGYLSSENFTTTEHYTGFPNKTSSTVPSTLAWDDGTKTFTISPSGASFDVWINGVKYSITAKTYTLTAPQIATSGLYWIWATASAGVISLNADVNHPGFGKCLVATVYWNAATAKGLMSDERHWMGRDQWYHEYLHYTVGARWYSGGTITPTDTTFSITQCNFFDEDIEHILPLSTACRLLRHNGSAAWDWTDNSTTLYYAIAGIMQYNNGTTITPVDNNKYVNYWVFATNNYTYPFMSVIGTAQHTTLAAAQAATVPGFGSLDSAEYKLLYKVTYRQSGTSSVYETAQDYRTTATLGSTFTPTDHSILTNLTYATSGHTGFHPTISSQADVPGLTIASSPIFLALTIKSGSDIGGSLNFVNAGYLDITAATRLILNSPIVDCLGSYLKSDRLEIYNAGGTKFSSFTTAQSVDIDYALPTTLPVSVSKWLKSTTGGVLSWEAVAQADVTGLTTTDSPAFTAVVIGGLTISNNTGVIESSGGKFGGQWNGSLIGGAVSSYGADISLAKNPDTSVGGKLYFSGTTYMVENWTGGTDNFYIDTNAIGIIFKKASPASISAPVAQTLTISDNGSYATFNYNTDGSTLIKAAGGKYTDIPELKIGTLGAAAPGSLMIATAGIISALNFDGADTTHWLRKDGTWTTVSASLPALTTSHIWAGVAGAAVDCDVIGDLTLSAATTHATFTIANGAVTYAKMQNISADQRILGNISGGAGAVAELTAANVSTILGTSYNSFQTAYGQAYRTTSYTIAANNTWYDLNLDGGDNDKVNITHSTVTNPARVTVALAGVYEITYGVVFRLTASAHHAMARLYKNNTSEIVGSAGQDSTTTGDVNEHHEISRTCIVTLSANDYLTLQVGSNNTGAIVDAFDNDTIPDPTTRIIAIVTIKRIG